MENKMICIFSPNGEVFVEEPYVHQSRKKRKTKDNKTMIQVLNDRFNLAQYGECYVNIHFTNGLPYMHLKLKDGLEHCETAPSRVHYTERGFPSEYQYRKNGMLSSPSPNIPAVVTVKSNGSMVRKNIENYVYRKGKLNLTREIETYKKENKINQMTEEDFYLFAIIHTEYFK